MDHPRRGLKYVDAGDLDDSTVDFDGVDVIGPGGDSLGDVDGFIVDVNDRRPYYVVVSAGNWFKSKYVLLPVGQAIFDPAAHKFVANISRDRIESYPGFDRDTFDEVSDAELNRLDDEMIAICSSGEPLETSAAYRSPDWWTGVALRERRRSTTTMGVSDDARVSKSARNTEQVVVRDAADDGDVSPHPGGRAQPGDVLGLETGGEQTHIGDTSEDENEWRRDAEKAAGKVRG
jgi:hypothetical protein